MENLKKLVQTLNAVDKAKLAQLSDEDFFAQLEELAKTMKAARGETAKLLDDIQNG